MIRAFGFEHKGERVMISYILRLKGEHHVHFASGQALVVKPLKQQCGDDENHTRNVWQRSGCDKDIGIEHICG